MKLLALSDVHGDAHWMRKMAEKAAEEREREEIAQYFDNLANTIESSEGALQCIAMAYDVRAKAYKQKED